MDEFADLGAETARSLSMAMFVCGGLRLLGIENDGSLGVWSLRSSSHEAIGNAVATQDVEKVKMNDGVSKAAT